MIIIIPCPPFRGHKRVSRDRRQSDRESPGAGGGGEIGAPKCLSFFLLFIWVEISRTPRGGFIFAGDLIFGGKNHTVLAELASKSS